MKEPRSIKKYFSVFLLLFLFGLSPLKTFPYSVFTHEAVIDATWDSVLKPALLEKYKNASTEDLKKAKAFAYGGSIIADMGYYPFGSRFFTDLTHYVRSGDFVMALYDEASTLNETAFALGVLSHYYSDNIGHPSGTNIAVPLMFPKLRKKFGNQVSYYNDKTAHKRMEFSFDVVEIAKGSFAPEKYRELIGFEICKDVLEKAFFKTYGLHLKDVFMNLDLAVSSFRWTVKELFPGLVKAAWATHKDDIEDTKSASSKKFTKRMTRREYVKQYQKPGFGAYMFSFFIRIIPKVGPLKALQFKAPSPEAEKIFIESFNTTVKKYSEGVKNISKGKESLENKDSDTGKLTIPCEYVPADKAYAELLLKNSNKNFADASKELKTNIWNFYKETSIVRVAQKGKGRKLKVALDKMQSL
jgi:hypothetical protein